LRFFNYDRSQFLNFEIEKWNTSGDSFVWVQLPLLYNGMNGVVAEWGNPDETNLPAYTSDGSTWSQNYEGVWHLHELNSICKDSSPNANNGSFNNVTHVFDGQVDGADDFDGTTSSINIPSDTTLRLEKDISVSLWIKPDTGIENWDCPVANAWDNGDDESGYSISYVSDKLRFLIKTDSMASGDWNTNPGFAVAFDTWQHIAGTYDGSTIRYYVDADQKETRAVTGNINWTFSPQAFYIGKFQDDNEQDFYDGTIDEVRISSVARSADWLWASHETMADNNSFTSYIIPEPGFFIIFIFAFFIKLFINKK